MKCYKKMGYLLAASFVMSTVVIPSQVVVKAEDEIVLPVENVIEAYCGSVSLNSQEVTTITPDSYEVPETEWTQYEGFLSGEGKYATSFVKIPVVVDQPGYISVFGEGVLGVVDVEILNQDNQKPDQFYQVGTYMRQGEKMTTGIYVTEPGTYYVKFYKLTLGEDQKFNFRIGFTTCDKALAMNQDILVPGLDGKNVYLQYEANQAGLLKVTLNREGNNFGWSEFDGTMTLCNANKKVVAKEQKITAGNSVQWAVNKGTYFVKLNLKNNLSKIKGTFLPYLKTPTITSAKVGKKVVEGKATKATTVNVQIGKKVYKAKVKANGTYSVKVAKITKKAKIKVWLTNTKGQVSKSKTVIAKK